jgi:hypothetical protein
MALGLLAVKKIPTARFFHSQNLQNLHRKLNLNQQKETGAFAVSHHCCGVPGLLL